MSSKLEPTIWSRNTGHIGIHGRVDARTVVEYNIFLPMMLYVRAFDARSSAIIKMNLSHRIRPIVKGCTSSVVEFCSLAPLYISSSSSTTVAPTVDVFICVDEIRAKLLEAR